MAYKLLDSNGNYIEPNGMHKGTIIVPYVYNGMELYNENTVATNRYAFYSSYRRVYTGSGYVYPTGSTHYYTTAPYASTSIIINGRYSSSSYKDYEVYKDGNLVASGSYTSSTTNIYTCEKDANTSIIVSGMWDSTNSKFIYNITTNATINRQNTYSWDNSTRVTLDFYQSNVGHLGSNYPMAITDTRVTFYSDSNIATRIKNYYGCDEVIINSITDRFRVYNSDSSAHYFNVYDDSGNQLTTSQSISYSSYANVEITRPSGASYYTGKWGNSSTSTTAAFSSSYVHFESTYYATNTLVYTKYNVTLVYYPKRPVTKEFTFVSTGRFYCDGYNANIAAGTYTSPSDTLTWCGTYTSATAVTIRLNGTTVYQFTTASSRTAYSRTIDVSNYTSISCSYTGNTFNITAT